ncbi:hypothetical protein [Halpernia sp.]|uniref:hypothetical protein n=1 Tax=Halpernia sp. TaxID=2782209 RepID=UPI003A8F63B5
MECKVTEFMKDLNSLQIKNLEKWFNTESKIWIPPAGEIVGVGRILALFRAIFRKYENLEWNVGEIFNLGNEKYFYESTSKGFMSKSGIYSNQICTIISFNENGKIKFLSDYFKNTACFH